MRILKFVIPTIVLFLFIQSGIAQKGLDSWKLVSKEGNIEVFTRKSAKSSFKEVRILAEFDVEMGAFIDALNDVPAYEDWIYKCKNPRLLKTLSENESYYYVQTELPFPMSDRDLVVHSRQWMGDDGESFHTHSVAAPDFIGEKNGMIRIQYYESHWDITENEYGRLLIEYKVITDPGGYLPAWLVNMVVTQGPVETMKELEIFSKQKSLLSEQIKKK